MSRRTTSVPVRDLVIAAILGLAAPTAGHSWIEQLQRIAMNGTMLNSVGYQRGFVGRGDPGFTGSVADDEWLLPPNGRPEGNTVLTTDTMCSPQQSIGNYSAKYPMLTTAPGDYLALRHEENGHVTKPFAPPNKPSNRGTIYIYGTENPSNDDTFLAIHNVWTADGQGGDKRGRLLATRNFDDGQCYQQNDQPLSAERQQQFAKVYEQPQGDDLWCQSDIRLPSDLTVGSTYTLYWVWDWPTLSQSNSMPGDPGVNVTLTEIYTACIDMNIVDPCDDSLGSVKSPSCGQSGIAGNSNVNIARTFVKGQDLNHAAVQDQLSDNFAVTVPGMSVSTQAAPSPTTLQTVTTAPLAQGGVSTVTVTAGVTTVTVTASDGEGVATATSNGGGRNDGQQMPTQTPGAAPQVTPVNGSPKNRLTVGDRILGYR